MKFRKKPVVIEAWQFNGNRTDVIHMAMPPWLYRAINTGTVRYQDEGAAPFYTIETREGTMRASVDDWIIRGVEGELYPCKPEIFEATYEEAE